MAFGLQAWNPGGTSLSYRPTTPTFAAHPTFADVMPGGIPRPGGMPPETLKPAVPGLGIGSGSGYGMYTPGQPAPVLSPNAGAIEGIDKLMQLTGMLASNKNAPGAPVDMKQAAMMPALLNGPARPGQAKVAGTGKQKKMNEAILGSIMSLGLGGAPAGGGNRGKPNKGNAAGGLMGMLGGLGGMPVESKGPKKNKGKGKGK